MLYPINDLLLGSGKHTVSIQVYPRTGETEVTKDAGVNIKVVHYKEKLVGMPETDLLLGSGKHTVSIQVYPRTGETEVTKDAGVNIKVVHYKEKLVGMPETLVELDTPTDIGMKKM